MHFTTHPLPVVCARNHAPNAMYSPCSTASSQTRGKSSIVARKLQSSSDTATLCSCVSVASCSLVSGNLYSGHTLCTASSITDTTLSLAPPLMLMLFFCCEVLVHAQFHSELVFFVVGLVPTGIGMHFKKFTPARQRLAAARRSRRCRRGCLANQRRCRRCQGPRTCPRCTVAASCA